jgi:hypothetical protein
MSSEALQFVVIMKFETTNITGTMVSKTPKVMETMGSDTLKEIMGSETEQLTGPWVPSNFYLI